LTQNRSSTHFFVFCRYLETFKAYEHKGCESIQERVDADYAARSVGW
jgi:hypothetical protein